MGKHCRFDGQDFLRRLHGKKIMFIGDSVSLNQWQSLMCLLHAAVPNSKTIEQSNESLSITTFQVSELWYTYQKFPLASLALQLDSIL